jgi:hypothetical protein
MINLIATEDEMKASILLAFLVLAYCPAIANAIAKTDPLFLIERNKNKNVLHYEALLTARNDLPDKDPVTVYWILENGQREGLTSMEKKYAYGIASQERIERDKFKIILVALKDREITVQKVNGDYKALVNIQGKESILDKVYIEAKEKWTGFPKVVYIDLYGHDEATKTPVKERIVPK